MEKTLLTLPDVAAYLKVSTSQVYKWCMLRQIPFFKVGGQNRFDLDEVNDWVRKNRVS